MFSLEITTQICVDQESTLCKVYAGSNLCSGIYNGQYIATYCALACGTCNSNSTSVPCVDLQSSCPVWASLNLCSTISTYNPVI